MSKAVKAAGSDKPASPSRRKFAAGAAAAAALAVLPLAGARGNGGNGGSGESWRAPAEWEPHAGTLMAFPWDPSDAWGGKLKAVQAEVAAVANAIARFEPVIMIANPGRAADAIAMCGPGVTVIEYPINDCWARDTAPIFVLNQQRSRLQGRDFQFNGWGNKYPYDKDDVMPVGACAYLGVEHTDVAMVLEGGAVITDGQGTLIATEECLLNPNRNPGMSKSQIEATLLAAYGASKLIWIPYGLEYDDITNGHIDLVASYVAPARLLIYTAPGTGRGDEARMAANKAVLEAATDARGRALELVEIHQQPRFTVGRNQVLTFSYTNYYRTNGGIVVPIANVPDDAAALAVIQALYPDREVIGVPARTLAWGGGGVHCITQHIPATN
ncbi:agmatine deiminase [Pseudoduganella ginsengisoli]|uniref:Agmatine deiminase n=1 Tax=Pseudoduganella ginsengisoli TaxID=1462440 RepID=A0A6L6PYC3_9BURK|nr:agmatine deiminase family protein [Pseudoduganella ginsengisoli]MTW01702.1 agmatine deiminase [Pseudoduganella ginsengisoli]